MPYDSPAMRDFSAVCEKAPATNSILPSSSAPMRCTGPMNAPGPPPTIPIRNFFCSVIINPLHPILFSHSLPHKRRQSPFHLLAVLFIAVEVPGEKLLFVQQPPYDACKQWYVHKHSPK